MKGAMNVGNSSWPGSAHKFRSVPPEYEIVLVPVPHLGNPWLYKSTLTFLYP